MAIPISVLTTLPISDVSAPLPDSPASPPVSTARNWSTAQMIGFRFAFSYLALYNLPTPGLQAFAIWVGRHLLHITRDIPVAPTGSGDTLVGYLVALVMLVLAITSTVAWSVLDRKRQNYQYLWRWLHAGVRVFLALRLVGYGASKVFQVQFPPPDLTRLAEPIGDASPMGLLWTFMGYSYAYNVFAGLAEIVGPALLCTRRTATLGALICVATLSNIVILNFAFDVPVKLYSLHLLAMACFVLAPDVPRLVNVLIRDRATAPRNEPPLIADPVRYRKWRVAFRVLATAVLMFSLAQSYVIWNSRNTIGPPSLHGIFAVRDTMRSGAWVPVTGHDSASWKRLTIGAFNRATIRFASDSVAVAIVTIDSLKHTLVLDDEYLRNQTPRIRTLHGTFSYEVPTANELILTGRIDADSMRLRFSRTDEKQYPLMNRGFHWIQEQPFNR
jgi:hypothetical protein